MPEPTIQAVTAPSADDVEDPEPRNPVAVGEISEAIVLARLVQLGFCVSQPFGNNQRYDFVVDDGSELRRVQVKTGRLRRGYVVFATRSINPYNHTQRAYIGQADDFVVYCPETNEIYRVPVDLVGHLRHGYLRVDEIRSGRKANVRWAHDFVFDKAMTREGKFRKPRPERFRACDTNHPDRPSRIKEKKASGKAGARWYCMECALEWERRRKRDRAS